MGDFRPICLSNCVYKIITKVLANRLAIVIGSLVNSSQSAFINDRCILDSVVSAQEVIINTFEDKTKAFLLNHDFEKAFDNVRWSFLLKLLRAKGFPELWIS